MPDAKTRDEVIAISNAVADEWGIPRLLLLACGIAEGNLVWNARRPARATDDERFWPDVSGGAWQQTVRYDPEYAGGGAYPGPLEVKRILERQYDVERSAHVAAANLKQKLSLERPDPLTDATDDQMLRAMFRFNWPGGAGKPYTAAHEENYRRGLVEAKKILGAPMPRVAYNPQEPAHPQDKSFDCSQEAAEWAMWSLGRKPDDGWMEATMIAEGVMSPDQGLLDGSGAGLAAFILRQYGEFGFKANNEPSVSWAWITAEGGHTYPVLAGGRGFGEAGHWIGVKGYDAARGALLITNPADGYDGIGQEMTEAQWNARGPWSAVRIWHNDLLFAQPAPPPVVVPPVLDRAAVAEKIRAIMALAAANYESERREWASLLAMVEAA